MAIQVVISAKGLFGKDSDWTRSGDPTAVSHTIKNAKIVFLNRAHTVRRALSMENGSAYMLHVFSVMFPKILSKYIMVPCLNSQCGIHRY